MGDAPAAESKRPDAGPTATPRPVQMDGSTSPVTSTSDVPDARFSSPPRLDDTTDERLDSGLKDQGVPDNQTGDMHASDALVADAVVADAMVADAIIIDAAVVDAAMSVCGNGQVEAGEECDDGNLELEPCEREDVTSCRVCDSRCQFQDVLGPSCGDGIHQVHEACDPQANNLAAAVCTPRCTIGLMGGGGLWGQQAL